MQLRSQKTFIHAEGSWRSDADGAPLGDSAVQTFIQPMRSLLPRPSGRLVPVATSSVCLVGSTVTERLGWLAERDPETHFLGPWLAGAGQ